MLEVHRPGEPAHTRFKSNCMTGLTSRTLASECVRANCLKPNDSYSAFYGQ